MSFEERSLKAAEQHLRDAYPCYDHDEPEMREPAFRDWKAAVDWVKKELAWQPIETAPKDGTWVFLSNHIGEVWVGQITRSGPPEYPVEKFYYKEFPNDYHSEIKGEATRWMAIPQFDELIGMKLKAKT